MAVLTKSGFTARIVSSQRPSVPILALTDQERTFNQLALVWGVIPELVKYLEGMFIWGHPRSQINVVPNPSTASIVGMLLPGARVPGPG